MEVGAGGKRREESVLKGSKKGSAGKGGEAGELGVGRDGAVIIGGFVDLSEGEEEN